MLKMSEKSKSSHDATRGYRVKTKQNIFKSTPSTSTAQICMEFIPSPSKQSSNESITCKKIEDEEYPRGYTLLETLSSPTKENNKSDNEYESDHTSGTKSVQTEGSVSPHRLSLLADFDELMRVMYEYISEDLNEEFLKFAEHQELCRLEWLKSVKECRRLQAELDKANHEIGDFQVKLKNARRLLDQERKCRRKVEEERYLLEQQMSTARDLLFNEQNWRLPDDTKEKLSFLNNNSSLSRTSILDKNSSFIGRRLDTINEINSAEINSTASLLSEFSYSRSDGELDTSTLFKMKTTEWKQPNNSKSDRKSPKRINTTHKVVEINPTDKIVATTTLALSKDGPIRATSVIEAVPQSESDTSRESRETEESDPKPSPLSEIQEKPPKQPSPRRSPTPSSTPSSIRAHIFVSKAVICPDICAACQSRIRFGKIAVKCKECRSVCHVECKHILKVPCIPVMNTPTKKSTVGTLSDYTPNISPMVPALLIHCINEIELRALKEVGLYRIPGTERDIKNLMEKILHCKTSFPNLNDIDVHVLCGVVKNFLRSLNEPLVTYALRNNFIRAAQAKDEMDITSCLYQAISQLPQPNRDTLAYMMLHLNRIAANRECKMPSSNLCKIFAPTLIGFSSDNIEMKNLLPETKEQILVMEQLMKIPIDFWSSFLNVDSTASTPKGTPSTSSLLRGNRRKFFTPDDTGSVQSARKRKKYFGTPPTSKK